PSVGVRHLQQARRHTGVRGTRGGTLLVLRQRERLRVQLQLRNTPKVTRASESLDVEDILLVVLPVTDLVDPTTIHETNLDVVSRNGDERSRVALSVPRGVDPDRVPVEQVIHRQ